MQDTLPQWFNNQHYEVHMQPYMSPETKCAVPTVGLMNQTTC